MYNIDLNFGRTRQVDAYNGMTVSDFASIAENDFDVVLDDEVLHPTQSDLTYYFNLWGDTLKHNNKTGKAHDFDAFITWMKKA